MLFLRRRRNEEDVSHSEISSISTSTASIARRIYWKAPRYLYLHLKYISYVAVRNYIKRRYSEEEAPTKPPKPLPQRRRKLSISPAPEKRRPLSLLPKRKPMSGLGVFGKLPYELRRMIYMYILGSHVVDLTYEKRRRKVHHFCCSLNNATIDSHGLPPKCHRDSNSQKGRRAGGKLSLLKTCRAIYIEACPLLYSTNTFGIFGIENLQTLLYFEKTVRPWKLALVSRLDIHVAADWNSRSDSVGYPLYGQIWKEMWDVIANKMTGMRYVTVRLKISEWMNEWMMLGVEPTEEWVRPMLQVKGLRQFRIDIAHSSKKAKKAKKAKTKGDKAFSRKIKKLEQYLQTTLSGEGFA